jgi:glycerol dehydrogenase
MSMLSIFSSPGRYVQGPGATQTLGTELKGLGFEGPVVIVASNSAQKLLSYIWRDSLLTPDRNITDQPRAIFVR